MVRKSVYIVLLGTLLTNPIQNTSAREKTAMGTIRIAMVAPRGSSVVRNFRRIDRDVREATDNKWKIRIYSSGVAGDEKDVIRKMRVGMMDSAIISTTGLSQVVREVAILNTPGVVDGYHDIQKIRDEMWDEWQQTFWQKGIKLIAWYPAGEYRLFTRGPLKTISDLKSRRPWLWPESFVLKELWRAVGATGVPLALSDVYGALQTGMIDTFFATAIVAVTLRWQAKVDRMTESAKGVLLLAWVMNKDTWDELPGEAKAAIAHRVSRLAKTAHADAKNEDRSAYMKLQKRGIKTIPEPSGFDKVQKLVFTRLQGRVFSQALAKRLANVTGK